MEEKWNTHLLCKLTFTSEAIPSVPRLAIAQETANSVSAVGIIITRECYIGALINICISER